MLEENALFQNEEKERRAKRMMRSKTARRQRKEVKVIRQIKLDKEERLLYDEFDRVMERWKFDTVRNTSA